MVPGTGGPDVARCKDKACKTSTFFFLFIQKMSNLIKDIQRSVDFRRLPNTSRPSPPGYASYEWVAAAALNAHALIFRHSHVCIAARHSPMIPYIAPRHAVETQAPVLHLSKELLEAFLATNPPEAWEWRMPYHSFIINLPKGSVKTKDWEVYSVIVACPKEVARWHMEDMCGEQRLESFHETKKISIGKVTSDICIVALCSDNGHSFLHQTWERAVEAGSGLPDELIDRYWKELGELLAEAGTLRCPVIEELCRVSLNAIACINTSPEIITEELGEIKPSKGFGKEKKEGTIRWIGKDFLRKQYVGASSGEGTSKTPHWRRGHWHTVRHGINKTLKKLQWFQPVFIGAAKE